LHRWSSFFDVFYQAARFFEGANAITKWRAGKVDFGALGMSCDMLGALLQSLAAHPVGANLLAR
jgi:hypothetical protein